MSSNSASEDWGKRAENTPFKGMGEQISKLVGQSPVESTTPDTPKTVEAILLPHIQEFKAGHLDMVIKGINALRRADMEAVIGEDEPEKELSSRGSESVEPHFRNELRARQRKRMKERLNG